jgi:Uri superfamily endonuclease
VAVLRAADVGGPLLRCMANSKTSFVDRLASKPGTYALVLSGGAQLRMEVGRFGTVNIHSGFYVYIGSALGPGGIRARIGHHEKTSVRPHWHVDYLRLHTSLQEVWYSYASICREHEWASLISALHSAVRITGFGCSDCRCQAHLFYFGRRPSFRRFRAELVRAVVSA